MMGSDAFDNLPIDIDTLAAFVEGDLDCHEADAVLEGLLQAEPELAAQVEMMARDRVMLRTLGDHTPPAGLGESVLARLEREALLDLRDDGALPHALPVSKVLPVKSSRWFFRRPVVGAIGVLAAAGLVIVSGIVLQLGNSGPGNSDQTHTPLPPMAKADTTPTTTPTIPNERAANPSSAADHSAQLDLASSNALPETQHDFAQAAQAVPAGTRVGADHPAQPVAPDANHTTVPFGMKTLATNTTDVGLAAADATGLESAEPVENRFFADASRALALLDEGRLLVRVQSVVPLRTTNNLAQLVSRRSSPSQAWHLERDVPSAVLASVDALLTPETVPAVTGPIVMADSQNPDHARLAAPDSDSSQAPRVRPISALSAMYLADTRHDAAALASLLAALSLGDGQRAVFEELAKPVKIPPVYTQESVLWWSRSPSQWVRRANVPVVVERIERE